MMVRAPLPSGGGPLPQPLIAAVMNDPYEDGGADISVTRLISPPRQVALAVQYKGSADVQEDPADRIWSLIGQSVHTILERANVDGIAEKRLWLYCRKWKVSGGFDHLALEPNLTLSDYKVTSVWKVKAALREQEIDEWEQQLNLLAHLARQEGYAIDKLQIVALMRDWRKQERLRYGAEYPERQVAVIPIPLWSERRAQDFLEERVAIHQAARVELPECTNDERWMRPIQWAAMKKGRKSAVKLFTDKALAEAFVEATREVKQEHLTLTERPGEYVRCANYCSVANVCAQWQASKPAPPPPEVPESWQPYLIDGNA
jgi:hypothetical protein